jgi:hypothetical protein
MSKKREDGKNAKTVASNKWNKKAYWRFTVSIKKESADLLKKKVDELGITPSKYVNLLLAENIEGFDAVGEKTKKGDKRK